MVPRIVSTLIGVWLMVAPDVLDYGGAARISDRIVGPMIAASAIIAISEATRPARWAGLPLGAWLLAAPWVLRYDALPPTVNSVVAGVLVITLSLIRGAVHGRYGGGWSALRQAPRRADGPAPR